MLKNFALHCEIDKNFFWKFKTKMNFWIRKQNEMKFRGRKEFRGWNAKKKLKNIYQIFQSAKQKI